jgi:hypothetical protein
VPASPGRPACGLALCQESYGPSCLVTRRNRAQENPQSYRKLWVGYSHPTRCSTSAATSVAGRFSVSTTWSSTCARSNTSAVWAAAPRNQSGSPASRERMRSAARQAELDIAIVRCPVEYRERLVGVTPTLRPAAALGQRPRRRSGSRSRCPSPLGHRRQFSYLFLGEVEPDSLVDPDHGADRDGDLLPAP